MDTIFKGSILYMCWLDAFIYWQMKVIISEAFFLIKALLITYYWFIRVFPKLYKVGGVAKKGLHGKEQTVLNIWLSI